MGTNFYLRTPACPSCGHSAAELHIGKSSAGWYFGLRVYPLRIVSREPETFIFGVPVQINPTDETVSDGRLVPFGVSSINELDDRIASKRASKRVRSATTARSSRSSSSPS